MNRGPTGTFRRDQSTEEAFQAFIPQALPPVPPIDWTGPRHLLYERALLACGRLDAVTSLLPDPDLFLYGYVRREAVLSSQIEGTQSSLSDLLIFELAEAPSVPIDDVAEVSNYVAALEHGLARLREGFPLCNRLLREMHEKLMASGRGAEQRPGEFRQTQNWIGGTRPGNALYVPPPPHDVEPCMADLERFLHSTGDQGALIKAGLAHVQFESIHPFLDGNGRLGRLLIAIILHHEKVLAQPLLYLSLYFKQHRDEYYRLLTEVRQHGMWEAWLDFFLEGVAHTASSAVETAHRLIRLFEGDAVRIQQLGRQAANGLRVFHGLRARPVTDISSLTERVGISFPTASRILDSLKELGIVRELTGRSRNRVFAYDQYLAILNEGSEPSSRTSSSSKNSNAMKLTIGPI